MANGLVADDGERQCWATIRSGLAAGLRQPVDLGRRPATRAGANVYDAAEWGPRIAGMVRGRLSAECRDVRGADGSCGPPDCFAPSELALMEPYHEPAWDGVYGVVEEDQSEDLDETHPYLVRCDFPHQSVPMHRCMWFSAWELVEPTTAERIDQLRKCGAWPGLAMSLKPV